MLSYLPGRDHFQHGRGSLSSFLTGASRPHCPSPRGEPQAARKARLFSTVRDEAEQDGSTSLVAEKRPRFGSGLVYLAVLVPLRFTVITSFKT